MKIADFRFAVEAARAALPREPHLEPYWAAFRHGSMRLGFYAPRGKDLQEPHLQDELYLVVSGSATFTKGERGTPCTAGDVLFVEAGVDHRFSEMSADFATWVVFWGPAGGEA
jgi:hypothetical protein